MRNEIVLVVLAVACHFAAAVEDYPPPPMPKRPAGFNIHCDVCQTMIKRTVPYCERDEQNMDFLPDFCTFNYNKVLRTECEYLVDVMEYSWCPNACTEVRRIKSFASERICYHPLVNCTERAYIPPPSASPSPSPSTPLPYDCVLCEFVLKNVAVMCMNHDTADKLHIYQVCMEKTANKQDFDQCTIFLNELVVLAGTEDPCTMLSCAEPQVACTMDHRQSCHVSHYDGVSPTFSKLGMDENGNLYDPKNISAFGHLQGLGPGDFKPGVKPYHSEYQIRTHALPPRVRRAGHLLNDVEPTVPVTPEGIAAAETKKEMTVDAAKSKAANEPAPTPIPLKDITMQ